MLQAFYLSTITSSSKIWNLKKDYMTTLEWNDRYSLDNDELDKQHKNLFSIFNMLVGSVGNDNLVGAVIDELVSYSHFHFSVEEQYMIKVGYNDIDRHIKEHKYFLQRASELKQNDVHIDDEQCQKLVIFLSEWLLHHIMTEDKKITH
jgi:hemerythrin-like metal-binding protein